MQQRLLVFIFALTPCTCMQADRGEVEVEEVQRDLGAMSTEEQRAAVMRDAPELAALLADLQSNLAEVRGRVGPLLTEVRACKYRHSTLGTWLCSGGSTHRQALSGTAGLDSAMQDASMLHVCPCLVFWKNRQS